MSEQCTDVLINGLLIRLNGDATALRALERAGERWVDGGAAGIPLWRLHAADAGGRQAHFDATIAPPAVVSAGGTLTLVWPGLTDAATGAGPFDVRVEIAPGAVEGATAWRIAVENGASDWTLWDMTFPDMRGLQPSATPEADRFFDSEGWGREKTGWTNAQPAHKRYPRGWDNPMQLMGCTRGGHTFYFGAHDPRLTTKEFLFSPQAPAGYALIGYPEGMTRPANGFRMEYDVVVAVIPGDWYDAAQLYAGWARPQAWAQPRAAQVEEPQAWVVLQVPDRPLAEWSARMARLQARLGVRLGVHLYNWHRIPFDSDYPEYFPVRPGVKELIAELNAMGMTTMPYINARLWDINAPSWPAKGAERHAAKGTAQRLYPRTLHYFMEEYGSGQQLAPMCPTTAFWQDTVIDLCRRITGELGAAGVYLDQVAAEGSRLCVDPAHGHPLGGGGFWLAGYRTMMRRVREAIGEAPYLTTECNWEGAIGMFDALLMWHTVHAGQIPLFPAVYGGQATTFGLQFNEAVIVEDGGRVFAERQAMCFVWGAQLGWGDLTLLLDHEALRDYFHALCTARAALGDLFRTGRMLRPPAVEAATRLYAARWQGANGAAVTLLVNPSREEVAARVDGAAVSLPPLGVRVTPLK